MEKKYAIVIGADRISNNSDIDQMKQAGLLNGITSVVDLQTNMGANKAVEMGATNIAVEGQYRKMAVREFSSKGVNRGPSDIAVSKFVTKDSALFIVAK